MVLIYCILKKRVIILKLRIFIISNDCRKHLFIMALRPVYTNIGKVYDNIDEVSFLSLSNGNKYQVQHIENMLKNVGISFVEYDLAISIRS